MPPLKHRHTIKYNNQLLYFCFDAADAHFNNGHEEDPDGLFRNISFLDCNGNRVRQLHRIQSIQYNFKTNFAAVNQFGHFGQYDAVMPTNPDVTIDFEYILSDGYNENVMGFVLDGKHQALSKIINAPNTSGSNIFLGVAPQGHNVVDADLTRFGDRFVTVGFGNCFFSQYAITAEVGSVPKARVSFDAFNITSNPGCYNLPSPGIDIKKDCTSTLKFSLPDTYENFAYPKLSGLNQIEYSNLVSGIRPNDIKIYFSDPAPITKMVNDDQSSHNGCASIQGFTVNIPIGSTKINRVGATLGFSRALNFPATIEIEVNAIMGELKQSKSIMNYLCNKKPFDITLELYDCSSLIACDQALENKPASMRFVIKSVSQISESFSSTIGDSKSVNLKFTGTVAGSGDTVNGLFIEAKSFLHDRPRILSWGQFL